MKQELKVTGVETLRLGEYPNLLWVRVHTDAGISGLGETYFGAGAVEAHIHETLAARLLGRDPLRIEALNRDLSALPLAQASTGAESRAVSAIDVALWDIFGKTCGQPVHQMLGGLCHDSLRVYNTCAGSAYTRSSELRPVANWALGEKASTGGKGAVGQDDLDAFMTRADALAEELLADGITAMKIWPFDPAARESGGPWPTTRPRRRSGSAPAKRSARASPIRNCWSATPSTSSWPTSYGPAA